MKAKGRFTSWMLPFAFVFIVLSLSACATIPDAASELSNTVGRDLEELHRSHRALANLLFDMMEDEANRFIDDVYAPAYIKKFAGEFKLEKVVKSLAGSDDPEDLLKTMVRFVSKAYEVIAEKRAELVDPIKDQRKQVVNDIDTSHRQLQAAQAVISGHIASVRKVQDVQNELLSKVGLEGVREKVAEKTAEVSSRIAGYIKEAEKAEGQMDTIENALTKIKEAIDDLKEKDHE